MSKELIHVPQVVTDNETEVYYVKCSNCGEILWYPDADKPCKELPALGINVMEGVGAKDRFGG